MLALVLTNTCCKEIISRLIQERGWSVARIARTIGSPSDYVERILQQKQSFQVGDVETLAKAVRLPPAVLILESMNRAQLSAKDRKLFDLALEMAADQAELMAGLVKNNTRKPIKKRPVANTAA